MLPREEGYYVDKLRRLNLTIRDRVMESLRDQEPAALAEVARETPEDTIFRLDEGVDEVLLGFCDEWARECTFAVVAEGIEGGRQVFPQGRSVGDAEFVLIVDPIDGTRPLMYDKRPAWVLSAVAENRGEETNARDIRVATQTEIPISKQYLASHLWAVDGQGYWGETHDVLTGRISVMRLRPSAATTLENGFAGFVKFFPAGKAEAAALELELFSRLLPSGVGGASIFDDQYISSGGQLYELMVGHERFVADIRPVLFERSGKDGLASHPYDLCTELIAREAGVIVRRLDGELLDFPLNVTTPVSWAAYANETLHAWIEPVLRELLG